MSAEIAAPTLPGRQKPRFLPAAQRIAARNSAEIAAPRYRAGKNHAFCRPPKGSPRAIPLKSPKAISANKLAA
jgi:hypothetical protein